MKKMIIGIVCLTSLPILGMIKTKAEKSLEKHPTPKSKYKAELGAFYIKAHPILAILALSEENRKALGYSDTALAGVLDERIKELDTKKIEIGPVDTLKLQRAIAQLKNRLLKDIEKLIDTLNKETDELYDLSQQNAQLLEEHKDALVKHLTRLNSLYNALSNALESIHNEELDKKIKPAMKKLTVVRETAI